MKPESKRKALQIFLRVYAIACLAIFGTIAFGIVTGMGAMDIGGPLHWIIWDRITDHVGPMIVSIYLVWAVYMLRASAKPEAYGSFLNFTMWANLVHGIVMIPMALSMEMYHSKFFTDIPFVLGIALGLWILRQPSHEAAPDTISVAPA